MYVGMSSDDETNVPHDLHCWLEIPYSQKDKVRGIMEDAIAWCSPQKKWYLRTTHAEHEELFSAYIPKKLSGKKRKADSTHNTPTKKSKDESHHTSGKKKISSSDTKSGLVDTFAKAMETSTISSLVEANVVAYTCDSDMLEKDVRFVKEEIRPQVEEVYAGIQEDILKPVFLSIFNSHVKTDCVAKIVKHVVSRVWQAMVDTRKDIIFTDEDGEESDFEELSKKSKTFKKNASKKDATLQKVMQELAQTKALLAATSATKSQAQEITGPVSVKVEEAYSGYQAQVTKLAHSVNQVMASSVKVKLEEVKI